MAGDEAVPGRPPAAAAILSAAAMSRRDFLARAGSLACACALPAGAWSTHVHAAAAGTSGGMRPQPFMAIDDGRYRLYSRVDA
ncbi:twin-arginine translocation signal domain-containing protein [Pseudoxanthomonas sp. NC8]|nr:twin-arginine translocation signal domain-containing protein [Pseudoxanthomonas sp. NC8]